MKRFMKTALTVGCLSIFASAPVHAATVVLDQFQLDGSEQNQAIHSVRPVGQTFTAGLSGLLATIELSLFESGSGGDLLMEILDFSGGDIDTAAVLGSVSKTEAEIGASPSLLSQIIETATVFDFTGLNIGVTSGDALAFRLSSARVLNNGTNLYAIRTSVFTDRYAGGAYFVGNSFVNGDAAFKVSVSAVPLSGTAMMLVISLAGLGALGRSRRKS